jgi:hypothetical protein
VPGIRGASVREKPENFLPDLFARHLASKSKCGYRRKRTRCAAPKPVSQIPGIISAATIKKQHSNCAHLFVLLYYVYAAGKRHLGNYLALL